MTNLNFKEFGVYTGINRKNKQVGDARESFANLLYLNVNGIRSHALALKIYQSEGDEKYTPEEITLIKEVADRFCTPVFIDSLNDIIDNQ